MLHLKNSNSFLHKSYSSTYSNLITTNMFAQTHPHITSAFGSSAFIPLIAVSLIHVISLFKNQFLSYWNRFNKASKDPSTKTWGKSGSTTLTDSFFRHCVKKNQHTYTLHLENGSAPWCHEKSSVGITDSLGIDVRGTVISCRARRDFYYVQSVHNDIVTHFSITTLLRSLPTLRGSN